MCSRKILLEELSNKPKSCSVTKRMVTDKRMKLTTYNKYKHHWNLSPLQKKTFLGFFVVLVSKMASSVIHWF